MEARSTLQPSAELSGSWFTPLPHVTAHTLNSSPSPRAGLSAPAGATSSNRRTWPPIAPARRSPVLGAIQLERLVDGLKSNVQHEGDRADQDADTPRRGDGRDQQHHGIGRSIPAGYSRAATVLVSDMGDESVLLEGWRDGPSSYLRPTDAAPLRGSWQQP